MRKTIMTTVVGCLSLICANQVFATAAEDVEVKGAYVRAMIPGQTNTAAYFRLENHNAQQDHALVNVVIEQADMTQLHVSLEENGRSMMRRIAEVSVGKDQTATLEPGGMHVMLMGVHKDLQLGDSLKLTYVFEDGSSKVAEVPVRGLIGQQFKNNKTSHHAHS